MKESISFMFCDTFLGDHAPFLKALSDSLPLN